MKVRYILSVAKKDLRVEFRSKLTINFMFLFSLLTITIFSLALGFSKVVEDVGPGSYGSSSCSQE